MSDRRAPRVAITTAAAGEAARAAAAVQRRNVTMTVGARSPSFSRSDPVWIIHAAPALPEATQAVQGRRETRRPAARTCRRVREEAVEAATVTENTHTPAVTEDTHGVTTVDPTEARLGATAEAMIRSGRAVEAAVAAAAIRAATRIRLGQPAMAPYHGATDRARLREGIENV